MLYLCVCYVCQLVFCFFFFFQAEDGIRDYKVTGVQTCALPILPGAVSGSTLVDASSTLYGFEVNGRSHACFSQCCHADLLTGFRLLHLDEKLSRSEERRVGKECRSGRWSEPEEHQVCITGGRL